MKIDENLAEFYGVLLGDGCISKYKNQGRIRYVIRIDGNSITDKIYYNHLQKLIDIITNRKVKIRYRGYGNCIYIVFHHKDFALYLNKLGFVYGKKKDMKIPKEFLKNRLYLNKVLKGFFDTDGCIYFTKNNSKLRSYPIIELSTHDKSLLSHLKEILENKNFNVKISYYKDSIKLHGKNNLFKWMKEIGSNNIDKYSKFVFWQKYGYCPKINELSLRQRLKKIKNGPDEI